VVKKEQERYRLIQQDNILGHLVFSNVNKPLSKIIILTLDYKILAQKDKQFVFFLIIYNKLNHMVLRIIARNFQMEHLVEVDGQMLFIQRQKVPNFGYKLQTQD
jgi:hypothetical protein